MILSGLATAAGSALCIDGSNNLIVCTTGAGGVSGSGTSGQIAFFNGPTSITSEASGFGWDTTNKRVTISSTNTTGDVVNLSDTSLTSGSLLNISGTSTPTGGGTVNINSIALTDAAATIAPTTYGLNFSFANQGAIAHSQYAMAISNASVGSYSDTATEALLLLDQADATGTGNTAVSDALRITNSGGSTLTNGITIGSGTQAIGTAINIASTGVTTDISLQNGETIDNNTDGTLNLTATTTQTSGNLAIGGTTGLTFTGLGGDITFTNGERVDNDTNGSINLTASTLQLSGGATIVSDQASVDLLNTNTTTLNFAGAATTLNLGAGGSLTRAINIGTGTGADTISIGTGGTTADTINIGTGAVANSITIGTTTASSSLALDDDNWNISGAGAANFVSIGATTAGTGAFTTLTATPASTNDITFTLDSDSTLILNGLSAGSASSGLCVDSGNNVITCASGGPVSGSGTAGQIAFFNTSSSLTSETAGFGCDTTNKRLTITSTNTTGVVAIVSDSSLTSGSLFNFSATSTPSVGGTINIGSIALTDAASALAPTTTGIKYSFANQGAIAHSQYAMAISNASVGSYSDKATEALLLLDQADATGTGNTAVSDALRITNSGGRTLTNGITIGSGTQAIGTAINIASTGVTTDIVLQNAETIDNNTDGSINLTASTLQLSGGATIVSDQASVDLLNTNP